MITVAHRLRTVIDYDRLIVLDKGQVRRCYAYCLLKDGGLRVLQIAEFDTPAKLIEKEGGIFRTMCLKSGHFAELEAAAKAKDAPTRDETPSKASDESASDDGNGPIQILHRDLGEENFEFLPDGIHVLSGEAVNGMRKGWKLEARQWKWVQVGIDVS